MLQNFLNHWNNLQDHVVSADTVKTFKNRLSKCKEWGIYSCSNFSARQQQVQVRGHTKSRQDSQDTIRMTSMTQNWI